MLEFIVLNCENNVNRYHFVLVRDNIAVHQSASVHGKYDYILS